MLTLIKVTLIYALQVFQMMIVARALLSWFPNLRGSSIVAFLHQITEPVIVPIRALLHRIPALASMPIDLSPLAALLLIQLVMRFVVVI